MSREKSYLLVEYSTSNTEQIKNLSTNASPFVNLLTKSSTADDNCKSDEGINKIDAYHYILDTKLWSGIDHVRVYYNTKYQCGKIPLINIYEYDNNSLKLSNINNKKDVDVHSPIVSIDVDNNQVTYLIVPKTVTKPISSISKQLYTITPQEYSTSNIMVWADSHMKNGLLQNHYKKDNPDDNSRRVDAHFNDKIPQPDSDITVIVNSLGSPPPESLPPQFRNVLYCDPNDYISGWTYKYHKDNNTHYVDVVTKCIHYDITSSLEDITPVTCPADGDWPVTNTGRTASKSCPTGYTGTITRVCSDGQWKQPVSNCSAIAEIAYCPAVASTATTLAWPKTEQSKTATQKCPTGYTGTIIRKCNADGTWNTEEKKCTEETILDKLNNIGSISIGGTDIYIWYIVAALVVFVLLLLIVKVKSKKEDPMEKMWKMMGF